VSNGKRGGQPGNNNAANAKLWNAAIHRALDQKTRKEGKDALDVLAMKLIDKCEEGDLSALKEFGDSIEGKSVQQIQSEVTVRSQESWLDELE